MNGPLPRAMNVKAQLEFRRLRRAVRVMGEERVQGQLGH